MATRDKLNIHGIIDLEQLAGTLSNLIDRLDQQNEVITNLQKRMGSLFTQKMFQENFVYVQDALSKIDARVETIATASSTKIDGKTVSAGDLALSNYQQLQKLTYQMTDCVRTKEFAKQCEGLIDVQTTNIKIQKDLDRTCRMTDNFSKSLMNMNTRVGGVETALGGKIDKSDFSHIEVASSSIAHNPPLFDINLL